MDSARQELPKLGRSFVKEMQHRIASEGISAYEAFVESCERRNMDPYSNLAMKLTQRIYDADPIFELHD